MTHFFSRGSQVYLGNMTASSMEVFLPITAPQFTLGLQVLFLPGSGGEISLQCSPCISWLILCTFFKKTFLRKVSMWAQTPTTNMFLDGLET